MLARRSMSPGASYSSSQLDDHQDLPSSYRLSLSPSTSTGPPEERGTPPRTPPLSDDDHYAADENKVRSSGIIPFSHHPKALPSIRVDDDEDEHEGPHHDRGEQDHDQEHEHEQKLRTIDPGDQRVKKTRSNERTRSWAEEVERRRRKHEKRKEKDALQRARAQGPYGQPFWSVSTDMMDSLVEALNPSSSDLSHLPTAASVILANQRRSYRMDSDSSPSQSEAEDVHNHKLHMPSQTPGSLSNLPPLRSTRDGGKLSSGQLTVDQPTTRTRNRSDQSKRGANEELRSASSPASPTFPLTSPVPSPISDRSPVDPDPPIKRSTTPSIRSPNSSLGEEGNRSRSTISLITNVKTPVLSIDEIIKKHSAGVANAVNAVKEKARKEIETTRPTVPASTDRDTASPVMITGVLTPINTKSASPPSVERSIVVLSKESRPPPLPPQPSLARSSSSSAISTPGRSRQTTMMSRPASFVPIRTNSVPVTASPIGLDGSGRHAPPFAAHVSSGLRYADDNTGLNDKSITQSVQMGQALLDQLETGSTRSSTPSSSRRISFQSPQRTAPRPATPTRAAKLSKRKSFSDAAMATAIAEAEQEAESHAHAVYLRSTHLNRTVTVSRQEDTAADSTSTPRPTSGLDLSTSLRVSLAEVGSPTGHPVVIFLGLGCVRYLIALFDDIARTFNLRLICIDRWGLGKTDQVPPEQRTVMGWATVVEQVLDKIGVKEFQVLAHSAGSPYALACALKMGQRIRGKIHLLAPWVSADIDGSYKWLKWVPNGVIRGATAAEWRLQSYLLGKPPPLTYKPISHDARAPISSLNSSSTVSDSPGMENDTAAEGENFRRRVRLDSTATARSAAGTGARSNRRYGPRSAEPPATAQSRGPGLPHKGGLVRRASKILAPRSIDNFFTPVSSSAQGTHNIVSSESNLSLKNLPHGRVALESFDQKRSQYVAPIDQSSPSRPPVDSSPQRRPNTALDIAGSPTRPRPLSEEEESLLNLEGIDFILNEGFDVETSSIHQTSLDPHRPSARFTRSNTISTSSLASSMSLGNTDRQNEPAPTGQAFTLALTQASHAECEPGTTSDLLSIVLNREAKPWGFSYVDVHHSTKIWYGSEDDKISERSMRWMERCMNDVELVIRPGEGHSLMTSRGTLWDVFESLGKEARGFGRSVS